MSRTRFPLVTTRFGLLGLATLGLVVLIAATVLVEITHDLRERIEVTEQWIRAETDHGAARLDAFFNRMSRTTEVLVADPDAPAALTDPAAAVRLAREVDRMVAVLGPMTKVLLLAPDGRVVVDRAGPDEAALAAGLRPLPGTGEDARLVVLPPRTERDSALVARIRPVTLSDGSRGLAVVAVRSDWLARAMLVLNPSQRGRISLLTPDGLELGPAPGARQVPEPTRTALLASTGDGPLVAGSDPELGETLSVAKPVANGALRVAATASASDVRAAWHAHSLRVIVTAGALIVTLLVLLIVVVRQGRRRAAEERAYTTQLERHAEATAHLTAASDVETLLRVATEWIRIIIPAHQSIASVNRNADFAQAIHAISFSDRYARWRTYDRPSDGSGIYRLVCRDNRPMRMTQAEMVAHPAWRGFGVARDEHPPMRGWLAAPLIARDGSNLGLLQLTDRETGEFSETDESLLVQVAQLVSARLETLDARATSQAAHAAEEKAHAEAEAARAELARILSSISDGVCVIDRDWRVRYANPHAAVISGGRLVRGVSLWSAAPHLATPQLRERLEAAMSGGRPVSLDFRAAGDNRVFDVRAFPFEDGLTVVLTDRTRQAEIEAQLRQTQKMEALGQLTGGVAHDFNNLLTVILGNADIIVETAGDSRIAVKAARLLLTAAERASALSDRLLAVARRQPLDPRPVDVAGLVAETRELLARTLGERIEVRVVSDGSPARAMVDPGLLETALLNLALNARDAMPDGGVLTLATETLHIGADFAEAHPDLAPGPHVLLSVTDTGTGMTPAVQARAFEPFFTTKERGRGSGLGLSMVYGFLRQSGGHVDILCPPGGGTSVRLYLPADGARDGLTDTIATTPPVPTGNETVLLVEDDELVREHVSSTLSSLGYRVHAVGSGAEAEAAAGRMPPFALLLTDIVLPGPLNGRVLAERMRARDPALRVVFMSGYAEDDVLMRDGADALGAALLQKPFRRQDIAARVRAALDAGGASASSRASPPKSL